MKPSEMGVTDEYLEPIRAYFSRIDEDRDDWKPMTYVDRLEWRGWYVLIDGDTVRFGNAENDWVKPHAKDKRPAPLDGAKLVQHGLWLVVTSGPYEFIFYAVTRTKYESNVFNYRWRYKSRFRRHALRLLTP